MGEASIHTKDYKIHKPSSFDLQVSELGIHEFLEASSDAIALLDLEGTIFFANSQTEKTFGYKVLELIGEPIEILIPNRYRQSHIFNSQNQDPYPQALTIDSGQNLVGLRKDRSEIIIDIYLSRISTKMGMVILCIFKNISSRVHIEDRLRASLHEKEILLKEVHHRVKNNLQIISSLLSFQAETITDKKTKAIFQDARTRIKTIALLHERLYREKNISYIDFGDYVRGLLNDLFDAYAVPRDRISVNYRIDNIMLELDSLVNYGLIVNELVSNSIKYAFPDNSTGNITISLSKNSVGNILCISDDGIGIPTTKYSEKGSTLGLKLVFGLTKELKGRIQVRNQNGTSFEIWFPSRDIEDKLI